MKTKHLLHAIFVSIYLSFSLYSYSQKLDVKYTVPDFFVAESTAKIKGNFDNDKENTLIVFENSDNIFEAEIISENESEVTIKTPDEAGLYNLLIDEGLSGIIVESVARVISLDLEIGKTNLQKGEETVLEIIVNGIEGYTKPIEVSIKNNSPEIIDLANYNSRIFTITNSTGVPTVSESVQVTGIKRGQFNIKVDFIPDEILVSYDWEKLNEQWEKEFKAALNGTEDQLSNAKKATRADEKNHPITTTSGRKKKYEFPDSPKDSTLCNCGIEPFISHSSRNSTYTITKAMEDKKIAELFRKQGVKFPKKDKNNFSGQNISIVPGSAFATGYGDVVGGWANALATSWGKKPKNGSYAPNNINTESIEANSTAFGDHIITITPAKNEWSHVIGIAAVKTSTQAKAVDPVEFDRKLMKEFGRGKGEIAFINDVYGAITGKPFATMIADALTAIFHVTGITKRHNKIKPTTNTNVSADAKSTYLVKVNETEKSIKKYSRAYRRAKIVRPTFKDTKIVTRKSSQKLEKFKEGKIVVSNEHRTKVQATIKARARVRCKATGNGFSTSGIASKTAVCVVGFCVNEYGALKMDYIYDSGVFILSKNGKEIAETETAKFDEKINDFFKNMEKQLNGKSTLEIKQLIKNDVKDDLTDIFENWL